MSSDARYPTIIGQPLEDFVRAMNEEAVRQKGDRAEQFFVNEQGVIDMIEPPGAPPEEDSAEPLCGYMDGTTDGMCDAPATHQVTVGGMRSAVCERHVESVRHHCAGETMEIELIQ